tara:strand:- start:114 stop:515 length:402 start_codon:yes stop_codon:yes gene_type:complete
MRESLTTTLLLIFSVLLTTAVHAQENSEDARERYSWTLGYTPDKVINYYSPQPNVELKMDLFFPVDYTVDDKRPCIIFFFGGGWVGRPHSFMGSANTSPHAAWWRSRLNVGRIIGTKRCLKIVWKMVGKRYAT